MAKTLKTDKYYVRYLTEDELEIARKALELPTEYPVRLLKAAIRKALREEVSLVSASKAKDKKFILIKTSSLTSYKAAAFFTFKFEMPSS